MAQKRMFSLSVVDTDKFLQMPISARLLYYELGMRADDDGFVDDLHKILMFTGLKEDDVKILIAKQFIIPFESGVIVIRHWRLNNYLQNDRTKPTIYQEELQQLGLDKNNVYTLDTTCIHSIDKNRIDKNRIEQLDGGRYNVTTGNNNVTDDVVEICNLIEKNFNRTISPIEYEKIQAWLEDFDKDILIKAINESVFNNKKTFSYINGILRNWKTNKDVPEWFGKDIQSQEPTPEEKKEMEDIINNF